MNTEDHGNDAANDVLAFHQQLVERMDEIIERAVEMQANIRQFRLSLDRYQDRLARRVAFDIQAVFQQIEEAETVDDMDMAMRTNPPGRHLNGLQLNGMLDEMPDEDVPMPDVPEHMYGGMYGHLDRHRTVLQIGLHRNFYTVDAMRTIFGLIHDAYQMWADVYRNPDNGYPFG